MDSLGKRYHRLVRSFGYAFQGLFNSLKNEQNMQIHFIAGTLVMIGAWILELPRNDYIVIFILIGGMVSLELLNTAIERVVDLVTEEYHPLAKQAKDIAAAAVLWFAIISFIIGCVIFYRPFINFVTNL
ncbi:diacylglycerol kinase family protein [Bacillus solimangrovi]|uniref:Diacylglycerol kinase n=1 Tax=Bacillus solimangrovi TaxID=1305675 RepID=A0A1E5LHZ4_9BACI|nr:diacylglycerol kinase family protein [Bacillus solimangrovi]OEH93703.1 hypothetical protein BFG57_11745 [Bacillus solimangrovi]